MIPSRSTLASTLLTFAAVFVSGGVQDAFAGAGTGSTSVVTSPAFDLEYSISEAARPLQSVELWVTRDRGLTWDLVGEDPDAASPFPLELHEDGLYGFYVIARNASGPSSPPPGRETRPHRWATLDTAPPVAQLHQPIQQDRGGRRMVQIRWTVVDGNLPPRPIELWFRRHDREPWGRITPAPISNTGAFDWEVPAGVTGSVEIRLSARDEAGHTADAGPQRIGLRVEREVPSESALMADHRRIDPRDRSRSFSPDGDGRQGVARETGFAPAISGSARARDRAHRLYLDAITLGERGEDREAIPKLREAVRLDPEHTEAFAAMADILYRLGDRERALNAYEIALAQKPSHRGALRGSARAFSQMRDYGQASELLRKILRYNPADAETWLNLGDVAIFQGDEAFARECYLRATDTDPEARETIMEARKRLELLSESSRTAGS